MKPPLLSFKICSVVLLALSCFFCFADTVVVPNEYASVDGPSLQARPWGGTNQRWLQIYDSNQFSGSPEEMRITAISYRIQDQLGASFSTTSEGLTIRMSATTVSPATASPTFANNYTSESVLVMPLTDLPLSATKRSATSFDVVVPLPVAFNYRKSDGNLLVDIQIRGHSGALFLDEAGNVDNPPGISVFGNNVDPLGVKTFQVLVTQFTFEPVPEPNVIALSLLAMGLLLLKRKS